MTGFGRGECTKYDRRFKVELKSVNHRFSEFAIKLPRVLNPFEDKIRRMLTQHITRGKVDIWVSFDSYTQSDITVTVNEHFADAYMRTIKELNEKYGLGELSASTALGLLARNPDIVTFDKFEAALSSTDIQNEIWEALQAALEEAVINYNQMREAEGQALAVDITNHHTKAVTLLAQIKNRSPVVVEEHAVKLKDRIRDLVNRMGQKPDEGRLVTEIAVIADKTCIAEEVARLDSHMAQFSQMLKEDEAVGRKMDFLMQEMNREANTIGSKSSDIQITRLVVELKSIIEKIREQVQNIE